MAGKRKLEFLVLRYAPSAVSGEVVNFGLIGVEQDGSFVDVRLTNSWERLVCIDRNADVEWLQSIGQQLGRELTGDRAAVLKRVEEAFSGAVQLSEWKGCLTEDPAKEMEVLSGIYFPKSQRATTRAESGRMRIHRAMREAFEAAGVWRLGVEKIDIAPYTWAEDPLKIDFGYRVGNELKMFHAVAVRPGVDAALALAFRYPKIAAGTAREGVESRLTAVVEAGLERVEEIGVALKGLEESGVGIVAVSEMAGFAEMARVELRA